MASYLYFDTVVYCPTLGVMPRQASTYRLEPDVQAGLEQLSKALRRPKNKLLNEALRSFVQQRSRTLVEEMEAVIRSLQVYQQRDPGFERAIVGVAQDEASRGGSDPAEGKPAGAVQAEIRSLLHA